MRLALGVCVLMLWAASSSAQTVSQRGFVEASLSSFRKRR